MTTHAATPRALALASDADDLFGDVKASEIESFEAATSKPAVRLSMLRSVPDFAISAEVLRATYSDKASDDGVWGAIMDTMEVSDDVRAYLDNAEGIGGA